MEKLCFINRITRPKIPRAVCLGLALLAMASCAEEEHNYEGVGNEFRLYGHVTDVGNASITVKVTKVEDAEGAARKRYIKKSEIPRIGRETQVHNNYEGPDCEEVYVGSTYDKEFQPIPLSDIDEGDYVLLEGNIRESKVDCGTDSEDWDHRPVYILARQVAHQKALRS